MKKQPTTTIEQHINSKGFVTTILNCDICGYCPCDHIDMSFEGMMIKNPNYKKRELTTYARTPGFFGTLKEVFVTPFRF